MDFRQLEILKSIDFSRIYRDSFYSKKYAKASQMAYEYVEEEVKGEEKITQELSPVVSVSSSGTISISSLSLYPITSLPSLSVYVIK